jgi:hypothetical protein
MNKDDFRSAMDAMFRAYEWRYVSFGDGSEFDGASVLMCGEHAAHFAGARPSVGDRVRVPDDVLAIEVVCVFFDEQWIVTIKAKP